VAAVHWTDEQNNVKPTLYRNLGQ